jgi:hypothetical protein
MTENHNRTKERIVKEIIIYSGTSGSSAIDSFLVGDIQMILEPNVFENEKETSELELTTDKEDGGYYTMHSYRFTSFKYILRHPSLTHETAEKIVHLVKRKLPVYCEIVLEQKTVAV